MLQVHFFTLDFPFRRGYLSFTHVGGQREPCGDAGWDEPGTPSRMAGEGRVNRG